MTAPAVVPPSSTMHRGSGRSLLVLRHGRTAHNARGVWQGHLDIPLDATGTAQARSAAAGLRTRAPSRIVSSDLVRAVETARVVGAATGVDVSVDSRLREIHCGQWQGLSRADVRERFADETAALARGEDVPRGGDGETAADVLARARPAVDDALEAIPPEGRLLVVTHGVTARVLVGDLLGLDASAAWRAFATLDNCAWAQIDETPVGWRLSGWNVTNAASGEATPASA